MFVFFVDTSINLSVNIIKKLRRCCFMSYFNVLMKSASLLMDTMPGLSSFTSLPLSSLLFVYIFALIELVDNVTIA